jgi:amidase
VDDVTHWTATRLVDALAHRELSSRELLEAYLARIEAVNPRLNAVVTLDVEGARSAALAADDAVTRGGRRQRLLGLPMTVKDSIETRGMRTTSGFPPLAEHVPATDADAVARLRDEGAIVFGKTNLPTMAGDWQSYNPLFGVTNNPWDTARTPGGSSGGSAAAVAAGLTGLELGSDLRGSLRVPAHFCGVFCLKPTYGIVPSRGHIPGPPGALSGGDMGVLGPVARSADDLDLALDVLAGPDPARAVAWRLELPAPRATSTRDYRIAAWLDDRYCSVGSDVLAVLHDAVEALRLDGARIDDTARPLDLAEAHAVYERLFNATSSVGVPADAFDAMAAGTGQPPQPDEPPTLLEARSLTQRHRDWLMLHEHRMQLTARWASFFHSYDALLCPVGPTPAITHDHSPDLNERTILVNGHTRRYLDQSVWPSLAGAAYLPAAVAPVGRTATGLPVGMQIVAPYLNDRTAVDVARRIADVTGGYRRPPV